MEVKYYRRILDIAIEQCKAYGCKGCAYYNNAEWEEPCKRCARNCKDYWRQVSRNENNNM